MTVSTRLPTPAVFPRDERGVALMFALLVAFFVAALALASIYVGSNSLLVSRFHATEAGLHGTADGGLELARDALNRRDSTLPDTGFITVLLNDSVMDAQGQRVPGFTRSVYVGRSGGRAGGVGSAGQFGNNLASAVSIIRNPRGAVAARRLLLTQESWSKFAVAVNDWTNAGIAYGCGESIQGPFHSNTRMVLQGGCSSPRTLFSGPVSVVNSITNQGSGNYTAGVTIGAAPVTWPTPADLGRLRSFAQEADAVNGDYDLLGDPDSLTRAPNVRIDFVPIDVNGDGTVQWDEGYMRVFRGNAGSPAVTPAPLDTIRAYVSARRWPRRPTTTAAPAFGFANYGAGDQDHNLLSPNCGRVVNGVFRTAADSFALHTSATFTTRQTAIRGLLNSAVGSPRCYLGGDPRLFPQITGDTLTPDSTAMAAEGWYRDAGNVITNGRAYGRWIRKRVAPAGAIVARRADAPLLIPLGNNLDFRGIVYVRGSVAISGRLRGRVTVAATGNIMLGDDLTYVTPAGTDCTETGDILGVFSTQSVLIQDNNVQTPFQTASVMRGLYDDTPSSENYNMFILALQDWAGDNPGWPSFSGPNETNLAGESCGGAPRGCARVTGGITQGFVRNVTYTGGFRAGWAEAHAYDRCGAISPPPYWPTTGRYSPNRYYELDPVWLNQMTVGELFRRLRSQ
jgi:hypothetical protein